MLPLLVALAVVFIVALFGVFYFVQNKTKPIGAENSVLSYGEAVEEGEGRAVGIPQIIWTYWHSAQRPLTVDACIENWKKFNPTYDIRVLHEHNLSEFLPDVPAQIYAVDLTKRADWIRLALLAKYGGIWLDASIILTQSLDWVNAPSHKKNAEFVGFYLNGYATSQSYPVVENWFMAAEKNSAFIRDWFQVFHQQVILETTEVYLEKLQKSGVYANLLQKIGSASYHTMHVACQQILQIGVDLSAASPHAYSLRLLCAEQSAYAYHVQSHWKRRPLFIRLLWNAQTQDAPVLIKLRGGERRKIEFYLKNRLYRKQSLVGLNLS